MASPKPEIRALQQERLISITIGENRKPIQIQQKVLEGASDWFAKALKRDTFVEGKNGKLNFPDDDVAAWDVLIYWMVNHRMFPNGQERGDVVLVTKCWILGDKYDIKPFQDQAMYKLICYLHCVSIGPSFPADDLNAILRLCPPGSVLGRIFAEDLANGLAFNAISWDWLAGLDMGHLWKEFCKAKTVLKSNPHWRFANRRGKPQNDYRPHWTDYMVGGLAENTWAPVQTMDRSD
ncbi:uncharacterized protein MYCFIDRAFT_83785 [Pseudocercospora fijiensis CIRAD86]|uniref:BTB domain-containing protein n=1 Tax=Pseudocercospora fijiensis (strain CIRAD86) TaxID=383855 RepID=M3AN42_PSEFD|nr:uncharacterized protein MYCFIDRAFT_83785 [Pseudocercospora fijiensis CIRAD86]EME78872.1 hypothetical protein MYCFIDRAFT_83785 [Pseudocercospora fijiensis CIRAD86]